MQGAGPSAVSSQPAQDTDALDALDAKALDALDALDAPGVVSREYHDDVALALALVQAARSVEQVVDVSAGRYGTAVTYGPGQRVSGIVVRRPTPSAGSAAPSLVVEAHLVVATAAVTVLAAPPLAAPPSPLPSPRLPKRRGRKGSVRRRRARGGCRVCRERLSSCASPMRRAASLTLPCGACGPMSSG